MGTSCINTILTLALSDAGVFLDAVNTTHIRCRCRSKCLLFITSVAYKLCPQPTSSSMVDLLQSNRKLTQITVRAEKSIKFLPCFGFRISIVDVTPDELMILLTDTTIVA